ncbi:unnamed protein product [Allacma fusca]|uniref:Uncharacterized protein n=1 Tax=Allacma fusca TaxID=39272 RepID=A0A8J2KG31_9HEXA|nr:unnamed protein product [Allacma fusca]
MTELAGCQLRGRLEPIHLCAPVQDRSAWVARLDQSQLSAFLRAPRARPGSVAELDLRSESDYVSRSISTLFSSLLCQYLLSPRTLRKPLTSIQQVHKHSSTHTCAEWSRALAQFTLPRKLTQQLFPPSNPSFSQSPLSGQLCMVRSAR